MELWMVLVGWILFAGTHIGLSAEPIRSGLINKMGEKAFLGLYSLVALITFASLITAFVLTDSEGKLIMNAGLSSPWMVHICNLLMLLAFILLFCGFANPSPVGAASTAPKAHGVIRITRHPMNMSFALFGLSHVLTNRQPEAWIFYLGFVVFGVLGAMHQDRRKIRQNGIEFKSFVENTSILPFVAIITGKQPFKFGEISKKGLLLAIVVTVVARLLHPSVRMQLF